MANERPNCGKAGTSSVLSLSGHASGRQSYEQPNFQSDYYMSSAQGFREHQIVPLHANFAHLVAAMRRTIQWHCNNRNLEPTMPLMQRTVWFSIVFTGYRVNICGNQVIRHVGFSRHLCGCGIPIQGLRLLRILTDPTNYGSTSETYGRWNTAP